MNKTGSRDELFLLREVVKKLLVTKIVLNRQSFWECPLLEQGTSPDFNQNYFIASQPINLQRTEINRTQIFYQLNFNINIWCFFFITAEGLTSILSTTLWPFIHHRKYNCLVLTEIRRHHVFSVYILLTSSIYEKFKSIT